MRPLVAVALCFGCAAFLGNAMPAAGLYVYIPNLLVVSSAGDADQVLTNLEIQYGVTAAPDPLAASRPDLARLNREARIMEKHWQQLEAQCDANAVFALMYLTTTYGIRYHIQNHYFADNDYLSIITVSFANMYLHAYDRWLAGDRANAPKAWLEAFDYATSGQSSVMEDEFLGMNAHINYDLAVAIAGLGVNAPDGSSRKPDMDRVNHVLADVTDEVGYDIARYYGPSPPTGPGPNRGEGNNLSPDSQAALEVVFGWREHAWNNALAISTMPDPTTRALHDATMQQDSWTIAQGFHSPKLTSPAPERLAYCQTHP